jgi:hypothetical protein
VSNEVQIRVVNNIKSKICKVWITASEGNFLLLAWIPEGIALTPRSASAEFGYGFPKREPGTLEEENNVQYFVGGEKINPPFGTRIESKENECVSQVLINRFENNKYLDKKGFIKGFDADEQEKIDKKLPEENPRLRERIEDSAPSRLPVVYAPLFYTPADIDNSFWELDENRINWIDEPGYNLGRVSKKFKPKKMPELDDEGAIIGEIPLRQFDETGVSLIYEEESENWFCHWPEELLYLNDAQEAIFLLTNKYRSDVGKSSLCREIRGYVGLSRMVISEMQRAKIMYHHSTNYREGYYRTEDRSMNGGANNWTVGENLYFSSLSGVDVLAGARAAIWWKNSPYHYANIISDNWDIPGSTSLDVAGNAGVSITEYGVDQQSGGAVSSFDPPVAGYAWSEVFCQREAWVYGGHVTQEGTAGRCGLFAYQSPIGFPTSYRDDESWLNRAGEIPISSLRAINYFTYQGRLIECNPATDLIIAGNLVWIIGAVAYYKDEIPMFRTVVYYTKTPYTDKNVMVYSRPVHGNHVDWVIESGGTAYLQDMASVYGFSRIPLIHSMVFFKKDGSAGVFSFIKEQRSFPEDAFYFQAFATDAQPMQIVIGWVHIIDGILELDVNYGVGPEIEYTLTVDGDNQAISYTQIGEDTQSVFPYYDIEDELVYLKVYLKQDINNRVLSAGASYYFTAHEIVYPSLNRVGLFDVGVVRNDIGEEEHADLSEDSYLTQIIYLDPRAEDCAYAKLLLTKSSSLDSTDGIFGNTLEIYHNSTLIKTLVNENIPVQRFWIAPGPTYKYDRWLPRPPIIEELDVDQYALKNVYLYLSTRINISGSDSRVLPEVATPVVESSYDAAGSIGFTQGRALKGVQNSLLGFRSMRNDFLLTTTKDNVSWIGVGYNAGLPIVHNDIYRATDIIDDVYCQFARYQDRVVLRIRWKGDSWDIELPEEEQVITYANFDLDALVFPEDTVKDLYPLGTV